MVTFCSLSHKTFELYNPVKRDKKTKYKKNSGIFSNEEF